MNPVQMNDNTAILATSTSIRKGAQYYQPAGRACESLFAAEDRLIIIAIT